MDILLFGIQGSGKGTQGKILKDYYDMAYFETGAELRKLAKEDSELGQKIKSIIEAGHLVDNDVVMEIVDNFMENVPEGKGIFFDGIPRKIVQKETLDALLHKYGREFKCVILDLSEEDALNRLTKRRICSGCKEVYPAKYDKDSCEKCGGELITRTDDNADSIKVRLQAFTDETMPVIEKYEEEGKLIHVDGSKAIEEVDAALKEVLDPILK
ncbi:adenylate kinase family protein [Patescibacteria group bacterium]